MLPKRSSVLFKKNAWISFVIYVSIFLVLYITRIRTQFLILSDYGLIVCIYFLALKSHTYSRPIFMRIFEALLLTLSWITVFV